MLTVPSGGDITNKYCARGHGTQPSIDEQGLKYKFSEKKNAGKRGTLQLLLVIRYANISNIKSDEQLVITLM